MLIYSFYEHIKQDSDKYMFYHVYDFGILLVSQLFFIAIINYTDVKVWCKQCERSQVFLYKRFKSDKSVLNL